jgi:hypothetical protein
MILAFVVALPSLQAQYTPCDTPPPNATDLDAIDKMIFESIRGQVPSALTWDIPVRVSVFRRNDGSGWNFPYDNTFMDAFLSNMNAKLAGGPNTFHFFRCGPVNFIDVDQLYNGSLTLSDYSYNRNFLNLYIYNRPGVAASASFPWGVEPKYVNMPQGILNASDATGFHELGHTLGLIHTFNVGGAYTVPVTPNQPDHPYGLGGRELMIKDTNLTKLFPYPNSTTAGDRVTDTPPGCDIINFYPSSSTIAGCLDNNPNTPCVNGCLDGNPNTPCITGCTWDYTNCKYTGDYRDYNFDLIVDSMDVVAKNIMSYTGVCRANFTPGQRARADQLANFFLNDYYQEQFCGTLSDRVEIEGTSTGLNRVNVRIALVSDSTDYTQTIVNAAGDFNGKLPSTDPNSSVHIKANLKRFRSTDLTNLDNNWLSGLSTFDLICIQKHLLGIQPLDNGYKILAADANKNNALSAFDIVLFRKLILGIDTALTAYAQPWRFIPEVVTQQVSGTLQQDFNGGGDDTPFETEIVLGALTTVASTQYCEPNWPFLMKPGSSRNGFDAVKMGNICGPIDPEVFSEECPGNVALLVPNISVPAGGSVEIAVKGFGFQDIAAFQMGLKAPKEDFELLYKGNGVIGDFVAEHAPGALNQVGMVIKAIWMSDNLSPQTVSEGAILFKVVLQTKKSIPNLSETISLDNSLLETYFLTAAGGCKSGTSIEIAAAATERGGENQILVPSEQKIFCLPNPAHDQLTVLFDAEEDFDGNIVVHDMQGRLLQVLSHRFVAGRNVIELDDFARLPVGVLNISIFDGESAHAARIHKQ